MYRTPPRRQGPQNYLRPPVLHRPVRQALFAGGAPVVPLRLALVSLEDYKAQIRGRLGCENDAASANVDPQNLLHQAVTKDASIIGVFANILSHGLATPGVLGILHGLIEFCCTRRVVQKTDLMLPVLSVLQGPIKLPDMLLSEGENTKQEEEQSACAALQAALEKYGKTFTPRVLEGRIESVGLLVYLAKSISPVNFKEQGFGRLFSQILFKGFQLCFVNKCVSDKPVTFSLLAVDQLLGIGRQRKTIESLSATCRSLSHMLLPHAKQEVVATAAARLSVRTSRLRSREEAARGALSCLPGAILRQISSCLAYPHQLPEPKPRFSAVSY